jgi:hypothetical protein
MLPHLKLNNKYDVICIAVIIALILGMVTSVFFMVTDRDSYSAIYLVPNSIIHNSNDNTVLYMYGVKSSESGNTDYILDTYLNDKLIKTRQFSLNRGQILDEQDKITLPPDTQYPSKISLKLTTNTAKEEVHFWLK